MDNIDYEAIERLAKAATIKEFVPRGLSSRPIDDDIEWDTIEQQVIDGGHNVNITDNEYLTEELDE